MFTSINIVSCTVFVPVLKYIYNIIMLMIYICVQHKKGTNTKLFVVYVILVVNIQNV